MLEAHLIYRRVISKCFYIKHLGKWMSCPVSILAVKPLRVAVILAKDSPSYVTALVWSRGFYLPPAALINCGSSETVWANSFQRPEVRSTRDSLKKKRRHRHRFKPRFSLSDPNELNPQSPSHHELSSFYGFGQPILCIRRESEKDLCYLLRYLYRWPQEQFKAGLTDFYQGQTPTREILASGVELGCLSPRVIYSDH